MAIIRDVSNATKSSKGVNSLIGDLVLFTTTFKPILK